MMDIRHPPGHRIVDRNHRQRRPSAADGGEGILECRTWQRLHVAIGLAAGEVRIRSRLALIGDLAAVILAAFGHADAGPRCPVSMARAFSKSCGVSTPSGTASTIS